MKRRNFLKISLPVIGSHPLMADEKQTEKLELTFGVIADPQYADVDKINTRFYRNSIQKLTSAIKELNKHDLSFTVTLGDMIDKDFSSFADIMPVYKTAKAPQTFVLGNHDFDVADEDKEKVRDTIGMTDDFYSKTVKNWVFIYLDGTKVSTFRYKKDDPLTRMAKQELAELKKDNKPQAQIWNGAIDPTQMEWLANQLAKAKKSNKRVIIFNHYPVMPLRDPHNLWNNEAIVNLIAKYPNVVAYMNGHNHKGNYAEHKGCHYINFKGMVETEKSAPFAIVKCYKDRVEVNGYEPEPDRDLKI